MAILTHNLLKRFVQKFWRHMLTTTAFFDLPLDEPSIDERDSDRFISRLVHI
jgi:hypothetical protein